MAESSNRKKSKKTNYRKTQTAPQKLRKKTTAKSKATKKAVPKNRIKKMPAPKGSYKLFTIAIFLLFTIYLCGYILVFLNRPSVPVEMVTYGTIESASALKGLVIREEYVVTSDKAGMPVYHFSENEKIPKGEVICEIKDEETSSKIEEKIDDIDQDILKNLQKRSDLSIFQEDVSRIESNINQLVSTYNGKFMSENIMDIASLKNQIASEMNARTQIWLAENVEGVSNLSEEKNQYQQQLADSISTIRAEKSGLLSFQIDGQEEVLTPENIDQIEQKQVSAQITPKYLSKTGAVEQNEVMFKVVTSNKWHIVSYLPPEVVSGWKENDTKYLYITINEEEKRFLVTIEELVINEKEARVVFCAVQDVLGVIGQRNVSFRVQSTSLEGIKIPNNAIIEKTMLKIPIDCIIENSGQQGVNKVVNNKTEFVPLQLTRYSQQEGFAYVVQDFSSLKVGDIVAIESEQTQQTVQTTQPEPSEEPEESGELEEPEETEESQKQTNNQIQQIGNNYTISEVETMKGVFVANSSIAKFTVITIMGQNEEYTIVSPGSSSYELQAYDTIVSDAKNIGENQTLY